MSGESRGGGRSEGTDFIRAIVAKHNADGTYGGRVETRFPPEPNGYLHIGHSKSIVLNFGLALENGGVCHLRFDDTNPLTEDMKYVRAIQEDVRWLGYDWGEHLYFASDYFDRLHECALILIRKGKAYVDSLSEDQIREFRGTVTEPGRDSPHRKRSIEENLDLFRRMKDGEFGDGAHVLRAKIDMAHPNMIMRDPVLYRIRHASHYRSGDRWCIYPLYDFTHCLSDAFENITHSLCTLEFDNNREIYDWLLDEVGFEEPRTHQYEFARLNLDYTVMSKRKLLRLVNEGHVDGWDDPRMPTIAGMRRRGITPEAIRNFAEMVGVAKADNRVDMGKLEFAIRDHLNQTVPRVMAVLRPLKVVLTNYPAGEPSEGESETGAGFGGAPEGEASAHGAPEVEAAAHGTPEGGAAAPGEPEMLEIPSYPHDVPLEGSRQVPFSKELYIERDDFMENPPEDFFRLAPGREVRLRYAYFIRCQEVVKDPATGEILELRCTYDPDTRGGNAPDGRKVKGTLHWVSARYGVPAEVRLYDRLFLDPDPEAVDGRDFTEALNPESRVVIDRACVEPSVASDPAGTRYQFERLGYFMSDQIDSRPGRLVFNRIVSLKDTWGPRARAAGSSAAEAPGKTIPSTSGKQDAPGKGSASDLSRPPAAEGAGASPAPSRGGSNAGRDARDAARRKDPELARSYLAFREEFGLGDEDADLLSGSRGLAEFFQAALEAAGVSASGPAGLASALANWMVNELLREVKDQPLDSLSVTPGGLAGLVALLEEGVISQPVAKEVFAEMVEKGGDPESIVRERGLERIGDPDTLAALVNEVLSANPEKVQEYRGGKVGLMGFFMGQLMKRTGGKADPELAKGLFLDGLDG